MPITLQDIRDHRDYYEITKFIEDMKNSEYQKFWIKVLYFMLIPMNLFGMFYLMNL